MGFYASPWNQDIANGIRPRGSITGISTVQSRYTTSLDITSESIYRQLSAWPDSLVVSLYYSLQPRYTATLDIPLISI